MVVRDQHDVDPRQLTDVEGERHDPARPGERHGRGAFGELRIDQHVEAGELDKVLTVRAHAVSGAARAKIEQAGGSVEVLSL